MSNQEENVIDVEFTEEINGKPLYFNTSQVSTMLSDNENTINDSTIRYWCEEFKDFLHVKRTGRNRKFSDKNIEELKFIKKLLKEDNLSIEQVKEYLSKKDPDILNQAIIDQEPLPIKIVAQALGEEIKVQLEDMRELIISEVNMNIENMYEKQIKTQQTQIDKLQERIDSMLVENLRKIQEDKQKQYEIEKKKGLFARIFNK